MPPKLSTTWERATAQDKERGVHASNLLEYEELTKPEYRLSASADDPDAFDGIMLNAAPTQSPCVTRTKFRLHRFVCLICMFLHLCLCFLL